MKLSITIIMFLSVLFIVVLVGVLVLNSIEKNIIMIRCEYNSEDKYNCECGGQWFIVDNEDECNITKIIESNTLAGGVTILR